MAVKRLFNIIFKSPDNKKENASHDKSPPCPRPKSGGTMHGNFLKNDDNISPLKESGTIAVIGAFAKHPRYQGGVKLM